MIDIEDQAHRVAVHAAAVEERCADGDVMAALRQLGTMHDYSTELAFRLCEWAVREGKTQKAIADALGVPASTLRGLKQSVT